MPRGTAFVGSAITAVDPGCPGNAKAVRRDGGGRREVVWGDDNVRRSIFFGGGGELQRAWIPFLPT